MFRTLVIASIAVLSIIAAPRAEAKSLQDIYQDMLIANAQKPCSETDPASSDCKASVHNKMGLAAETISFLINLPAPPRSPVSNALSNIDYMSTGMRKWTASNCDSNPDFAARYTTCTGGYVQN